MYWNSIYTQHRAACRRIDDVINRTDKPILVILFQCTRGGVHGPWVMSSSRDKPLPSQGQLPWMSPGPCSLGTTWKEMTEDRETLLGPIPMWNAHFPIPLFYKRFSVACPNEQDPGCWVTTWDHFLLETYHRENPLQLERTANGELPVRQRAKTD